MMFIFKFRPNAIFIITALAALAIVGCGGGSPGPDGPDDQFDRKTLLASVGGLVLARADAFAERAAAVSAATTALCPALGGPEEDARRAAARAAWRAAMSEWQVLELMRFGPLSMDQGVLRDRIYSWPVVSTCAVDQEVVLRLQAPASYDISTRLVNRRGLAALEHLLFADSLAATCPTPPAGWNELADPEKKTARCGLAAAASADLATQAELLATAWDPAGGNYLATFASAGGYPSEQEAVNVVSDALFFLDTSVKDAKLARPAGITVNSCGSMGDPCLADLESRVSAWSKENVLANLRGFELVFTGGSGAGFDDFLRARGGASVAAMLESALAVALAKVEAIPDTLAAAIVSDPVAVAEAHAAVRAITDILKSNFLTVLSLEIPDAVAGDND